MQKHSIYRKNKSTIFQKAVVIVWRESLEAALVIGIIAAFLNRSEDTRRGMRWAYLGIAIGIALSVALGAGMLFAENVFVGSALEWFQTCMLLLSAILMTQMVFWMQKHSRHLKKHLENEMTDSIQSSGLYSVMGIAAFAVVVFSVLVQGLTMPLLLRRVEAA